MAKNECDVLKFVPTSVRPTYLPYREVYNHKSAARFVSEYMQYEQLLEPNKYPSHLPSPASVLKWRAGDCFDFATVLCSILCGVGYDAYCVAGIAPMDITCANQALRPVPDHMKIPPLPAVTNPVDQWVNDSHETSLANMRAEAPLRTKKEEEVLKTSKWFLESFNETTFNEIVSKAEPEDDLSRLRVEPRKKLESDYQKLLQETERLEREAREAEEMCSDSDEEPPKLKDEFKNQRVHCWVLVRRGAREVTESFFIEPTTGQHYGLKEAPYLQVHSLWNHLNLHVCLQHEKASEISWVLNDPACFEAVLPSVMEKLRENPASREDTEELQNATQPFLKKAPDGTVERTVVAPVAWSEPLEIPRLTFEQRRFRNHRTMFFSKCTIEFFAPYSQPDGLVQRVTQFKDLKRVFVRHVTERFHQRTDKLVERVRTPNDLYLKETFEVGRPDALATMTLQEDRRRELTFYPSRLDGLRRHEEVFGQRLVQEYAGREDGIKKSSVILNPRAILPSTSTDKVMTEIGELPVARLSQWHAHPDELKFGHEVRADEVDGSQGVLVHVLGEEKVLAGEDKGYVSKQSHLFKRRFETAKDGILNNVRRITFFLPAGADPVLTAANGGPTDEFRVRVDYHQSLGSILQQALFYTKREGKLMIDESAQELAEGRYRGQIQTLADDPEDFLPTGASSASIPRGASLGNIADHLADDGNDGLGGRPTKAPPRVRPQVPDSRDVQALLTVETDTMGQCKDMFKKVLDIISDRRHEEARVDMRRALVALEDKFKNVVGGVAAASTAYVESLNEPAMSEQDRFLNGARAIAALARGMDGSVGLHTDEEIMNVTSPEVNEQLLTYHAHLQSQTDAQPSGGAQGNSKRPGASVLHEPSEMLKQVNAALEADGDTVIRTFHARAMIRSQADTLKAKSKSVEEQDEQEHGEAAKKADILAPYLIEYGDAELTAGEAEFVAKRCKADYRKRLLERAAIIQKRIEDEHEIQRSLKARQNLRAVSSSAQPDAMGGAADSDSEKLFERQLNESNFRVQILEHRLARHEAQAVKKFGELERVLATHPRLAALHSQKGNNGAKSFNQGGYAAVSNQAQFMTN